MATVLATISGEVPGIEVVFGRIDIVSIEEDECAISWRFTRLRPGLVQRLGNSSTCVCRVTLAAAPKAVLFRGGRWCCLSLKAVAFGEKENAGPKCQPSYTKTDQAKSYETVAPS
jgi:hypothetical protein